MKLFLEPENVIIPEKQYGLLLYINLGFIKVKESQNERIKEFGRLGFQTVLQTSQCPKMSSERVNETPFEPGYNLEPLEWVYVKSKILSKKTTVKIKRLFAVLLVNSKTFRIRNDPIFQGKNPEIIYVIVI